MPRRWYLLPCRTFQPVVVVTQSLPSGTQGTAYSFQFAANGGTLPYTWSLSSDTGSNTWNISASGLLTGTPANAETDTITAKVTDAVGGVALSAPLSLVVTASGGSPYVFKYFIAPSLGGTLGNDNNNGLFPTQGAGNNGPWTIGSLFDSRTMSPTATQLANNALMAGQQVGMVGDQGVLSLADVGRTYPLMGGTAMCLTLPNGTATNQTILASCNSSGQYVRGLAVLDGGCNGTEVTSTYFIGRFALTNLVTDSQYMTIDGLEVRNCQAGGIVYGQSKPLPVNAWSPGWVAINNFVHHVYNPADQFTATACSQAGNQLTVGGTITGTVRYGSNPSGVQGQILTAPWPSGTFINGFVSGTPGGAGVYTTNTSATIAGPISIISSPFAGQNLAGISFHGGLNIVQKNNFIQDVIDLNRALPNNIRTSGIKNWTSNGATVQFNTIYATAANGMPTGGIEFKNIPQVNYVCSNNYIHLANALNITGSPNNTQGDGEASSTVLSPNGHFATFNNNILVANPLGLFGFPTDIGGGNTQALLVNWFNNTMVGLTSGHGGTWARNGPLNGSQVFDFHDNITDRPAVPIGGAGDFRVNVGAMVHIDFDLWPANYQLNTVLNTGGGQVSYSASPPANGGISGCMSALTTGSGGATTGLENCGGAGPQIGTPVYVNASGTKLKATDWQLAPGSPGQGKGTGGSDIGAWGGGATQVGCNWRDPSG